MKTKNNYKVAANIISLLSWKSFLARHLQSVSAILGFLLATTTGSFAGSATWKAAPATNDWFTATNWTPATVPNGPADTASFASSNRTSPFIAFNTEVNGIVFNPGASAFTIVNLAGTSPTLTISGTGITNNSGIVQNFAFELAGAQILFLDSATAGSLTAFTTTNMTFGGTSSAGSATFTNNGLVTFTNEATADTSTFSNNAVLVFDGTSTAGNGNFSNSGGGFVNFRGSSSAANGTFTNPGGSASGEGGGFVVFNSGTAADATFVNNGGAVRGAIAGETLFNPGDAADATLIANGGIGGGAGGLIVFSSAGGVSTGGTARVEVFGNGNFDLSQQNTSGLTIGSIEGDGLVFLGANNLTVGVNNLSTIFSGVTQDGGINRRTGGSVTKTGTGTLTLSGANTYTGVTTVSAGTLLVNNKTGSGTGTGAVKVNAGILGGSGVVTGAVTVGTGSGPGATLAPAGGTRKQATLTTQSALTFTANATYSYSFKAKASRIRTDKLVAMGVTINPGATFLTQGSVQGTLPAGLVLTAINNTSATPIVGSFSNLPDGAIVSVNGNTLQADYQGGDGNDLTLTVVP